MLDRADLDVEGLLKIILVLVIAYIVLNLAFDLLEFALAPLLGPFANLIGLVIVVLIVLYFLDYI
jgi:hypothetical protein